MSLVALAARIATVRALTNSTWAGPRVFDSAIDPIDQRISEESQSVIVVLTDDDEQTIAGRDFLDAQRRLALVIEIAVASRVQVQDPEAEEGEEPSPFIIIPHTDAGLELQINLIGRQALRVLLTDQGAWATLWRRIVLHPERVLSRRGAGSEKGIRFAARQTVITTETLSEPGFGAPAEGFWADFLAAMEADADANLGKVAAVIRAEIESPSLPDWRRAIAQLGTNPDTAQAIGIAPVPVPLEPDEPPVPLAGITIESDSGADLVIEDEDAGEGGDG